MGGYHVRQRGKSKRWYAVISNGKRPDGSRDLRWIPLDPSITKKKDAEEAARKLAVLRDEGELPKNPHVTVGEFLDKWLSTATHLAPTSRATYESQIRNHIKPHLGSIKLHKLSGLNIQSFYAATLRDPENGKKGLAPSTVKDIHCILSKALGDAKKWGLINRDPTDGVTPPKVDKGKKKKVLSPEEAALLADELYGTNLYVPVMLLLWTGMRRGELLGLTWDKVDFDARVIYIEQALTRTHKKTRLSNPKTDTSIRLIPMSDFIIQLLEEQRHDQLRRRAEYGEGWVQTGAVIDRGDGDFWVPNTFSKQVAYHLKRLGFDGLTPHSMRHTHASILHRAGADLKAIQERLGHNDAKTTLSIYTHTFQDTQDRTTAIFEAAMKKAELGHNKSPVH